jgi:tRNA dimethylallyltransferase
MRPLVAIVGPTGAGKSSLGLRVAERFSGEIVNCDSLQLYRGFDIGTAKTPPEERRGIPHHLFDALSAETGYSAGEYAREARQVLEEISSREKIPVVVGGTGFYFRALVNPLPALPQKDEALRESLKKKEDRRPGSLHRLLARLDPESARRIHLKDVQKLIRALEIRVLTGIGRSLTVAAQPERTEPRPSGSVLEEYRVLILGLDPDRDRLNERLERRTRTMFADGLIEEVRGLLASGLSGNEKPFESLGYWQAIEFLRGECSLKDAVESTIVATRQYAKRQRTWFRREAGAVWLSGFGDEQRIEVEALEIVARDLSRWPGT